jgi:hypothetical protein
MQPGVSGFNLFILFTSFLLAHGGMQVLCTTEIKYSLKKGKGHLCIRQEGSVPAGLPRRVEEV